MFRNMFIKRNYWYLACKENDNVFNAYTNNPFFEKAKLNNHLDIADFKNIPALQLTDTLNALFLGEDSGKYIDALDKRLFTIKELATCTPEQRIDYLQKLSVNQKIKLKPQTNLAPSEIDEAISRVQMSRR